MAHVEEGAGRRVESAGPVVGNDREGRLVIDLSGDVSVLVVDGEVAARCRLDPRGAATVLVEPAPTASRSRLAHEVRARFPGHDVRVSDLELTEQLLNLGARIRRRVHQMACTDDPARSDDPPVSGAGARRTAPAGVSWRPLDHGQLAAYASLSVAAAPAGHPDAASDPSVVEHAAAEIRSLIDGTLMGPLVGGMSAEARSDSGALLGVVMVTGVSGDPVRPDGLWISRLLVDPRMRGQGIGGGLLGRVLDMRSAIGSPPLGLFVDVDNPDRRFVERAGFRITSTWATLSPS